MKEGLTGIEIKSGYGLDTKTEAKMLAVATKLAEHTNIRIQRTFLGAHAIPPEYQNKADDYIYYVCNKMLPELCEKGVIDAVDGFCEKIAFSTGQMDKLFSKAQSLGLPIKLHAEQLSNQEGAKLAATYGALSADHLEYIDEAGIIEMAKSGTTAVLLPGAFYFLRETQLPPIDLFRKHGVPIAIATDLNPGSSPAHSLLLMLNMACTLFHLTPEEALLGVTKNAAAALGWHDCGVLKVGNRADFALWDIDMPAELCYKIGFNPCLGVCNQGEYFEFAQPSMDSIAALNTSESSAA
jgi:imidazolonepropionase